MLRNRVIPCILLKNRSIVKTKKFKSAIYIGNPINTCRIFNENEVDELIIFDIESSSLNKKPQYDLLKKISSECFMPLCYGGGVKTLQDFEKIYNLGIEKVSVSTLFQKNVPLLKKAIKTFGSQSISICLDIKRNIFRKPKVYYNNGKTPSHLTLNDSIEIANEINCGEIILNSIDKEGTWLGFDYDLVQYVSKKTSIPVLAIGGCGSLEHVRKVIKNNGASAVGLGSFSVLQAKNMGVLVNFPSIREIQSCLKK